MTCHTSRKSIVQTFQTYLEFCVGFNMFQCSKPRIESMFNQNTQNTPEREGLMRLQCFESQYFRLSSVGCHRSLSCTKCCCSNITQSPTNHLRQTIYECKTGYHLTLHHPHPLPKISWEDCRGIPSQLLGFVLPVVIR